MGSLVQFAVTLKLSELGAELTPPTVTFIGPVLAPAGPGTVIVAVVVGAVGVTFWLL
jgi:hypothetical protein